MRTTPHHSTGGIYGLLCRSDVNLSQRDAVALHILSADCLRTYTVFLDDGSDDTSSGLEDALLARGSALLLLFGCLHACVPGKTTSFTCLLLNSSVFMHASAVTHRPRHAHHHEHD